MTAVTLDATGLSTGMWQIDPAHSEIGFTVRHLMTKVRGQFTEFEGAIEVAEDPSASSVRVTVVMDSIDTRNAQRDAHLRSNDFFAIDQHPTMTFASTGIRPAGDGFALAGELTVRGVTRPIELDAEYLGVDTDHQGVTRAGFEATATLNRKDFGVDTNVPLDGGRLLVGEEVAVQVSVQATSQA